MKKKLTAHDGVDFEYQYQYQYQTDMSKELDYVNKKISKLEKKVKELTLSDLPNKSEGYQAVLVANRREIDILYSIRHVLLEINNKE